MKRTISREKATKIATGFSTNETHGIAQGDTETDTEFALRITDSQFVAGGLGGAGGGEGVNFAKEIKSQGGKSLVGKKVAGGGLGVGVSGKDNESI